MSPGKRGSSYSRRDVLRGLAATTCFFAGSTAAAYALGPAPISAGRIDLHHHFLGPLFEKTAKARNRFLPALQGLRIDRSIEQMDRNGVSSAILSMPSPGVWYGDAPLARLIARDTNEFAARAASDHKGRFGFFAALPLPDLEGSLIELAYALDVLKADGIHMWTSYGDFWPGDARLKPLLEELNRRKAIVYTHPTTPGCCGNLLPEAPIFLIEYGTDTTRAIASLVFSGATSAFPDITWIFSHSGGTMPYLMERFRYQASVLVQTPEGAKKLPRGLMYELGRLHFETAQAANDYALGPLTHMVSKTQIYFGTDFPYRDIADNVKALASCSVLDSSDIKNIERNNALKLFPRFRL